MKIKPLTNLISHIFLHDIYFAASFYVSLLLFTLNYQKNANLSEKPYPSKKDG
jgi:hypothetical protein